MHVGTMVGAGAMLVITTVLMLATAAILVPMLTPFHRVIQSGQVSLVMNISVTGDSEIRLGLPGEERQQEDEAEQAVLIHHVNMTKLGDSDKRATTDEPTIRQVASLMLSLVRASPLCFRCPILPTPGGILRSRRES